MTPSTRHAEPLCRHAEPLCRHAERPRGIALRHRPEPRGTARFLDSLRSLGLTVRARGLAVRARGMTAGATGLLVVGFGTSLGAQLPLGAQPRDTASEARAARAGRSVQATLLLTLVDAGRDAEAERMARQWSADPTLRPSTLTTFGTVLARRGRVDEARQTFEQAIAARVPDSLTARAALGRLLDESGDRDGARVQYRRVVAAQEEGNRLNEAQWLAVGDAHRGLARTDPQRVRQALAAYDRAAAENPADAEPKLRAGALFLDRYNGDDARRSFEAVLRTNPRNAQALLGMARIRDFDGGPGAVAIAESSLVANPRLVDGHLFIAAAHLDAERYDVGDRGDRPRARHRLGVAGRALAVGRRALPARRQRGDGGDARARLRPRPEARGVLRDARRTRGAAPAVRGGGALRRAGRRARPDVVAQSRAPRHQPAAARSRRLGAGESRRGVQGRPVRPVDEEHARPARRDARLPARRGRRTSRSSPTAPKSTLLSLYLGDLLERG